MNNDYLYLYEKFFFLLSVLSSFSIILMGKRELVALLSLSFWCLVVVVWLFLAVPWVCLQFVILVFPDHTHLLFLRRDCYCNNEHLYTVQYPGVTTDL